MISFCVQPHPQGQKLTTNTLTFPRDDHVYEYEATTRELSVRAASRGVLAIFEASRLL